MKKYLREKCNRLYSNALRHFLSLRRGGQKWGHKIRHNPSESPLSRWTPIKSPLSRGDKGGVKDTSKGNNHNNKITISLLTPLRLRFDGHITGRIEFHVLIRNLLRRISSLSYFHCDEKLEMDFKDLIEKAKAVGQTASDICWFDWKRYSTRQEEWMSPGGVTGTVSYEDDLTEFMQLLKLGEYVHVGKGTSFGLGKYEIVKSTENISGTFHRKDAKNAERKESDRTKR